IAEHQWGQGRTLDYFASSLGDVPGVRDAWARWERTGASPSAAKALLDMCLEIDLRPLIGAISVPTLVMHHSEDSAVPVQCGRDLAGRIPGARYWEQPGEHLLGDVDALIGEIQHFVTGSRTTPHADRVLKTVLFLDIVDSTQHLGRIGDR